MQAPPLPQPDSTSSPVWKPPESTDSPASRVVAVSALPTSAVLPRRTPMAAVSPAGSGSPAARPRMSMLPPSASTAASEMSRSHARRVGKESVSTSNSQRQPYHQQQKQHHHQTQHHPSKNHNKTK